MLKPPLVALLALAFLPVLAASSAEVAISTAPGQVRRTPRAPRAPENPWVLTYALDRRGDHSGRVNYHLRWGFGGDAGGGGGSSESALPLEEHLRGLIQGMRVDVYGVRLRPFRDLSLTAPLPAADFAASTVAAAGSPAAPARRRPVYSWDRLYEDLQRSARRETERFIVREGFDRALPEHRAVPYEQKRALGFGLLDLGRGALSEEPDSRP